MDDCDHAGLVDDGLGFLGFREAVGDSDVAVSFGIDTRHLAAEELTVNGGVAELVDSDVIMNHLMEDGVFDESFGKVDTDIDPEDKVFVAVFAEETLLAASEGDFAEETF